MNEFSNYLETLKNYSETCFNYVVKPIEQVTSSLFLKRQDFGEQLLFPEQGIPNEVGMMILENLQNQDISSAASVNKIWNITIASIKSPIDRKKTNDFIKFLIENIDNDKYDKQINKLLIFQQKIDLFFIVSSFGELKNKIYDSIIFILKVITELDIEDLKQIKYLSEDKNIPFVFKKTIDLGLLYKNFDVKTGAYFKELVKYQNPEEKEMYTYKFPKSTIEDAIKEFNRVHLIQISNGGTFKYPWEIFLRDLVKRHAEILSLIGHMDKADDYAALLKDEGLQKSFYQSMCFIFVESRQYEKALEVTNIIKNQEFRKQIQKEIFSKLVDNGDIDKIKIKK